MQSCMYLVSSLLINKTQCWNNLSYLVHHRKVYSQTFDEARLTDHHYCLTLLKQLKIVFLKILEWFLVYTIFRVIWTSTEQKTTFFLIPTAGLRAFLRPQKAVPFKKYSGSSTTNNKKKRHVNLRRTRRHTNTHRCMQTDRLCVWQMCLRVSRCWVARSGEVLLHWLSKRDGERQSNTVKSMVTTISWDAL